MARCLAFYMHDLSGGGVERMRLALIAELRARGEQVTLIVGSRQGALAATVPDDLTVVSLECQGMLRAVRPLAQVLRRLRPDVLVASLDHNNVTALLAGWLSRTGTRVVICQHNALSAELALGWRYRAIPWLYWLLQWRAEGIVAVSRGVADDLAKVAGIYRTRITPIYNPVITDDFARRASGPAPHPWLADATPVLLFAGRLTAQKDPGLLLAAFALLAAGRDARLIVLGEGPLLAELQAQAVRLGLSGRVAFAGFAQNPLPWIAHAACLVLPSRYEGLGNVLVEALACGTPVVSTDCPHGPAEILLGGALGGLVAVGHAPAMAAAVGRVLDGVPDRAAFRARAAAFTAAACADAHQVLFDGIAWKEARPSFLKKRSKKLFNGCREFVRRRATAESKVFWSVSKKDCLLSAGDASAHAFGLRLSPLDAASVVGRIVEEPADDLRLVVTPNIDHVRLLRRRAFAAAYKAAHIVCPDGFPVLLYGRLRGLALSSRVTGCELFARLAEHRALRAKRMVIVTEAAATEAAVWRWGAARGLAGLRVISAPPGLARDVAAQAALAQEIALAAPDVLVMTLGAPVSEVFVHSHRDVLPPCWALCVGQAVRVHLGLTQRAPAGWQRAGLEWLWRIRQEPGRLLGRYVRDLAWFPVAVVADLLG